MPPVTVPEVAALLATALAVVATMPQLRRALAGDGRGVSLTAPLIGVVNETAWVAYTVSEELWSAAPEAALMVISNVVLVAWLLRAGAGGLGRAALAAVAWAATMAAAVAVGGSPALAVVLGAAYAVQVTPAVWTAWRTPRPTGVAAATWAMILVESLLWGVYGLAHHDPAVSMLAAIGAAAGVAMLLRIAGMRRLVPVPPSRPDQPAGPAPAATPASGPSLVPSR